MMRVFAIVLVSVATLFGWVVALSAQEHLPEPMGLRVLSNKDAWDLLPRQSPSLPAWARVLVRPLPKTTAAMLELDYLHRAKNPLEPALAGKLRLMTAHMLGSVYGKRYAEADLRRAGLGDDDLKKLTGDIERLPAAERAALRFARKMSVTASTVTDDEMADLLKHFGPEKTVAMVHTLAYANFHNRMIMAIGVDVETDGPLPPLDLQLDPAQRAKVITPRRPAWKELPNEAPSLSGFRLDWNQQGSDDLAKSLEKQKSRKARIPLPDLDRFAKLPSGAKDQAERIAWMTVSMGYQPQMTVAWFDCLRAFQSESAFDRVFSNSVFWVITRSNECFY
jgi:alkylhydroperoxidase family enzyme